MSENVLISLIFTVWILHVDCDYNDRAKIRSSNGNLYLEPAKGKSIYFRTNGPQSSIFLGDTNLININQRSTPFQTQKNDVDTLFSDLNDVLKRIESLENRITIPSDDVITNVSHLSIRIDIMSNRLNRLQRQIESWSRNQCQMHTCQNGGICLNLAGGFHCLCPENWEGPNCDVDFNECRYFVGTELGCQNGADCINQPGSYQCQCKTGWFGTHCTKRKLECTGGNFEMCGHGTCVPVNSGEGIKCICDQGWTTNGSVACLTDVNECDTSLGSRCSTNPKVECINLPGSFRCEQCPQGYQGDGYVCYDIDECATSNGGCSSMVSCHNTIGSRICGTCPPGYVGDGITCTWRGSCNIDHGGCHPSASCIENNGVATGVLCACPRGMDGDGVGIHGCFISVKNGTINCDSDTCGPNGECHILASGYTCICLRGFTGSHCNIKKQSCSTNPCKHGGVCIPDDTSQGFRCECTTQYTGTLCQERFYCGSILRAEEGNLMYPHSNTTYGFDSKCAWVIKTVPGKVINVTFSRFNFERSPDCDFNFLEIHDGRNTADPLIGRFCGDEPPNGGNIVSNQHNLYIWYLSNSAVARNVFALYWNSITPVCGAEVDAKVHGTLSSPGSPGKYPPNRDCYWHLQTSLQKRIQLHFVQLDLEPHSNCSFDYLAIYDGESQQTGQLLERYCSSTQPAPLQSLSSEIVIHFHSDANGSGKGFQITYASMEGISGCGGFYTLHRGEITSPSYDGLYLNNLFCEYKIKTGPETKIQLDFKQFDLQSSENCKYDNLKIYDGPDMESPIMGTYCGKLDRKASLNSTSNIVFIVFRTDSVFKKGGFKISYKEICNYLVHGDSGIIKSPGYPFTYPEKIICEYVIETSPGKAIQLTFQDFDIDFNIRCTFDYVVIIDNLNGNSKLLGKYCGNGIPPTQISSSNIMYVRFISNINQFRPHNSGFYANFTSINIECGGIYRDKEGTINHPSDDGKYKISQTCTWMILAPPGQSITLNWNRFDIEYTRNCDADYLEIYMIEDDNKNTSRKFCGQSIPEVMTVTSNTLMLKFVSDRFVQNLGFSVTYAFKDNKINCGGQYIHSHGTIYSPGWPNRYGNNLDCTWVISVPAGHQIKLNISQFNLQYINYVTRECIDYLRVSNGPSASSPLIGEYCGKFGWKSITSLANTITLKFHSNDFFQGKGFKIEWDTTNTGCGGTFTGYIGSISSPNYPNSYNENSECFYRIATNHGSTISLIFSVFALEQFCDDYVEIFDGRDPESRSLGRYCKMPPIIRTSSNYAFIKFRSDFSINGKGFMLNYNAICKNNITESYGVIESLNYPNNYPLNEDCTWTIRVPKGNKINVTFTNFDVGTTLHFFPRYIGIASTLMQVDEYRPACIEYLEISEPTSITLPKFCGSNLPAQISTAGNLLQISFHTTDRDRFQQHHSGFRLEWVSYGCHRHIKKSSGFISKTLSSSDQMECKWILEGPSDASIYLTFTKLYMLDMINCTTDAIEIYNGPNENFPLLTKFCHDTPSIQSTSNYLLVKLVKNSSLKDVHFEATFHMLSSTCGGLLRTQSGVINSKNYPQNYDNNLNCIWTITVHPGHRVTVEFLDIQLNVDESPCSDSIRLFDSQTNALNGNFSSIICAQYAEKIFTSKSNTLQVQFVTNNAFTAKGFKAKFSMTCGGVIYASKNGVITNNKFISHSNSSCVWTILAPKLEQKVSLTVTYLSLPIGNDQRTNQTCPNSYLRVLDGDDENAPLIDEYCGRTIPTTIVSRGRALTIQLGTHDDRINGQFNAYYSSVDSACGGILTSESGMVASPNYPAPYPDNAFCEWTLQTSPGNKVYINIDLLDINYSDECNEDYLEIREHDGAGRILGLYCGNMLPINTTLASQLYIQFRSNNKNPGRGFLIHYNFLHGNEITNLDMGEIASPLYPNAYDGMGEFWWRITSGNEVIIIVVDKLLIHSQSESCGDNLSIYDGLDDEAPLLNRLCGAIHSDNGKKVIKTTSNTAYIKLALNEVNSGVFFHLRWSQGEEDIDQMTDKTNCGYNNTVVVMPGNPQYFNSPNYPQHYDNNLHCEWVFKATHGNHLSLRFSDFDIEEREPCTNGDFVSIFESNLPAEWKPVKQNLCLYTDVKVLIDASKFIKVIFHSDVSHTRKGFSAQVISACGSVLTDPSGVIGVTRNALNVGLSLSLGLFLNERCDWKVQVRPGRRIKLEFEDFKITNKENDCTTYIILRNGESIESPSLSDGKYCGYSHENRTTMITSSNNLLVRYVTSKTMPINNNTFKLHYEEERINCGVNSKLDPDHSWEIIGTPNYPNVPDPYTECNWHFTGPVGEILRMDFIDRFDIHKDDDCISEFIEIHDGSTALSPVLGHFCENPGTIKTTSNFIYIRYVTELSEPNNGFKANISIDVCGGTIKSSQGEVKSPGYPNTIHLPIGTVCEWHIIGKPGYSLSITPQSMNILGIKCATMVTIVEWDPVNNTNDVLKTYCSRSPIDTSVIQTSSNKATIKLFINNLSSYRSIQTGFRLTFKSSTLSCGGKVTVSDGIITTPRYPKNTITESCTWFIKVPDDSRRITLEILDSGRSDITISDSTVGYSIATFNRYEITLHNTVFKSSGSTMSIYLTNSQDGRYIFKARFNSYEQAVCGGSLSGISGQLKSPVLNGTYTCKWQYRVDNSQMNTINQYQSILITGTANSSYSLSNKCNFYDPPLTITYSRTRYYKQVRTLCNGQFTNIIPVLDVVFKAKQRSGTQLYFDLKWKLQPCGGMVSVGQSFVNILQIPQSFNESLDCSWALENIEYPLIEIKLEGTFQSNCADEFIKIGRTSFLRNHYLFDYCKDRVQNTPNVISFGDVFIEYHSKAQSSNNIKVFVRTKTSSCGETLQYPGQFSSPNFPKGYESNIECAWVIKSQDLGFRVSLQFITRFAIEKSPNCTKDAVIIYDWIDERYIEIARLCDRQLPPVFNSTNDRIKVVLRTDNDTNLDGFEARWTKICDGTYIATTNEKYLYSPGYPHYEPSKTCIYKIIAPKENLQIKFLDFDLEGYPVECENDNLTISSSDYRHYFIETYCGNTIPEIYSMFTDVEIIFKSDDSIQNRGFKIAFSIFSCGGNITEPTMLSSGSHEAYNGNMNCTWFIEAPKNKIIVLEIVYFILEQSYECMNDYLAVYEGLSVDLEKRLALLCGDVKPSTVIQNKGNYMTVEFISDAFVIMQLKGFNIDVMFTYSESVGCGGVINLTSSSYTLTSPHINSQSLYENFLDCHWSIFAPLDHVIRISFSSFHIAPCSDVNQTAVDYSRCDCDFLQIKDGLNPVSLVIGTYCGNTLPPEVISSKNTLGLRLSTDGEIISSGFTVNLIVKESLCGSSTFNITDRMNRIKSPGYETGLIPRGIHCVYNIYGFPYQLSHIHFNDFDLQPGTTSEVCNKDRIFIYSMSLPVGATLGKEFIYGVGGPSTINSYLTFYTPFNNNITTPQEYILCGSKKSIDLYVTGSFVMNLITSPDEVTGRYKGIDVEVSTLGFCGRNFTELYARILSTYNYNINNIIKDCYTLISVPENYTISLYTNTVYGSFLKKNAYLDIYDGNTTAARKIYSTINTSPNLDSIFSSGNYILLHNYMSDTNLMIMYDFTYMATDKGRGCGGYFYGAAGTVMSPLYPSVYRKKNTCEWKLETPQGTRVSLHFMAFDLGIGCDRNYVQLVDRADRVLSSFCLETPADFVSEDNYVKIVFVTTTNNGGTGWAVRFISVL